jgi:hypothetical protein
MTLTDLYTARLEAGHLRPDPAQAAILPELQRIADWLEAQREPRGLGRLFRRAPDPPPGLYLWGGVGRGKSMLMDLFVEALGRTYTGTVSRPAFCEARVRRWPSRTMMRPSSSRTAVIGISTPCWRMLARKSASIFASVRTLSPMISVCGGRCWSWPAAMVPPSSVSVGVEMRSVIFGDPFGRVGDEPPLPLPFWRL